jgi:hypothetical protein
MQRLFSHLCEDTMYSLRIQVLVLVVAYYELALEERIGATGLTAGEGEGIRLKRGIRGSYIVR